MQIDVKILDERLREQLPDYATAGSAGLDLRACITEPLELAPGACELIKTGIAAYIADPANKPYTLQPLERLAQLVIVPVVRASWNVVESFDASDRGAGGYGSSGRH